MTGTDDLFDALEATWPPVRWHEAPGWRVGEGAGGGSRVSSAVGDGPLTAMAARHAELGQEIRVMVRPGQSALDARLAEAGYARVDPTLALGAPAEHLAGDVPPVSVFEVDWPPLEVQHELWAEGGIGEDRVAVMARAECAKVALLGRIEDKPAGTAFLGCHGGIAVLHALEITPWARRKGVARHMLRAAARWAVAQGARDVVAFVTEANVPARALYRGLGMAPCGQYHYRVGRSGGQSGGQSQGAGPG